MSTTRGRGFIFHPMEGVLQFPCLQETILVRIDSEVIHSKGKAGYLLTSLPSTPIMAFWLHGAHDRSFLSLRILFPTFFTFSLPLFTVFDVFLTYSFRSGLFPLFSLFFCALFPTFFSLFLHISNFLMCS